MTPDTLWPTTDTVPLVLSDKSPCFTVSLPLCFPVSLLPHSLPYHEPMPEPRLDGPRIAFFGGSFDPPHRGHLTIACAASTALHLDQILFAPVGAQPLKPLGATASFDDRVAMTRLAIANEPGFVVTLADAPSTTFWNCSIETCSPSMIAFL